MAEFDLQSIYNESIRGALEHADWYLKKKNRVSRTSRLLRSTSIFLLGLGTLFPLLGGILNEYDVVSIDVTNWGYIAIALAGTFILYDRYFGISSAWIRYVTTELEIRKQIKEFELKWKSETFALDLKTNSNPKTIDLLNLIRTFRTLIDELVKSETLNWAIEFQTNFSELEKTINSKVETMKPGSAKVTITNGEKYSGLSVSIDNQSARYITTNTTLFQALSVGYHLITVKGDQNGKSSEVAEVVSIEPSKLTAVDFKMP